MHCLQCRFRIMCKLFLLNLFVVTPVRLMPAFAINFSKVLFCLLFLPYSWAERYFNNFPILPTKQEHCLASFIPGRHVMCIQDTALLSSWQSSAASTIPASIECSRSSATSCQEKTSDVFLAFLNHHRDRSGCLKFFSPLHTHLDFSFITFQFTLQSLLMAVHQMIDLHGVASSFSSPFSERRGLISGIADEVFQVCWAASDERGFHLGGASAALCRAGSLLSICWSAESR